MHKVNHCNCFLLFRACLMLNQKHLETLYSTLKVVTKSLDANHKMAAFIDIKSYIPYSGYNL